MRKLEIDRSKREQLILLIKATGALWLSRFIPILSTSCGTERGNRTGTGGIRVSGELFPQSVASGDVKYDSALIWTRTSEDSSPLIYQVALDPNFENIRMQDVVIPNKENDFTVKVKIEGLKEGQTYFYRFLKDNVSSPVGRFRTPNRRQDRIRFAFVSCQDYTNGFYSAYYHLAQEDIDFVVHLGDYIYETVKEATFQYAQERSILLNDFGIAFTLEDYRKLYRVYKSDPYLQMVHERFPFYVVWDDHEFSNDSYGAFGPDNGRDFFGSDEQVQRRLDASRIWWEYIPSEVDFKPNETNPQRQIRIYREFDFGNLMRLIMTDERLYRSEHACGKGLLGKRYLAYCDKIYSTTMLGEEQLNWFLEKLDEAEKSGIIWKIHGNEVCMSRMILGYTNEGKPNYLNLDQWDGYAGERQRIFNFIKEKGIRNYVAVTGDLHTFVVGELFADFENLKDRVGVEFTVTSITSTNLGKILKLTDKDIQQIQNKILEVNPNIKLFNSQYHGYAICEVTPEEILVEFWRVSTIEEPEVEKTQKILFKKFRVRRDTNQIEDITP